MNVSGKGVKGSGVLVLGLAILLLAFGCAQQPAQPAPTAAGPAATAAPVPAATGAAPAQSAAAAPTAARPAANAAPTTTKPNGALRVAISDLGTERWLPHLGTTPEINAMAWAMDTLIRSHPTTLQLTPSLAEKWTLASDGLSETFSLRKGVQFHGDGGEFTAQDVKFSIEMAMRQGSLNPQAQYWRDAVSAIEITDPYTIVFRFKRPTWDFVYELTNTLPFLPIISKKHAEGVGEEKAAHTLIGTGPWKLVEYKHGESLKFEAVENHWRQTPQFKTLTVRLVQEPASSLAMLAAGEVDLIELPLGMKNEAEKRGVALRRSKSATTSWVALGDMWPQQKTYDPAVPWAGPELDSPNALKVRQAMNLAVNRQEIVDKVLLGEGEPVGLAYFVYPGTPFYNSAWKPYPYDPEKAKSLLKEAGYPNGFDIEMRLFTITGRTFTKDLGQAVGTYWEKVGIKVQYRPIEYAAWRTDAIARTATHTAGALAGMPYPEPALAWKIMFSSAKGTNAWGFEIPYLDKMIDQITGEMDAKKRLDTQLQVGQWMYDGYYGIPLASTNSLFGVSKNVGEWPQPLSYVFPSNFEYITHGR